MNRWSRLIVIFIAYGLALLHTAVPHQHGQRFADKPVISYAGCIYHGSMGGLLQMVLSTDLGLGHLETFKKGADADIDFSNGAVSMLLALAPIIFLPIQLNKQFETFLSYIEKLHKRLLLFSSRHLRAPPVFIF